MMTVVLIDHVQKVYTQESEGKLLRVPVVDQVSLKLGSGQVVAILGPSGCGKSTLLRMVAGLVEPDAGRVLYDDIDLRQIPVEERGIGMVFQEGALIPHWDVRQNIGFFLWLRKREAEVPERVRRISQITGIGLEKLLDRRPRQLSGGERQRVGIARALARDPRLFLFDEPFSNLDAKLRGQSRVELKKLLTEFPVTSLYVTHDQVEAVSLAHRIAVMRAGRIEQVGDYETLYRNPINLFVAAFIGTPTMNLFQGVVRDHQWHGEAFAGLPIRGDLEDGAEITLGVRAEHVSITSEGAAGSVVSVTPHFGERVQVVEVERGREKWTLFASLDAKLTLGENVRCTVQAEDCLFFDTRTGTRIG
jgi:multiple sugar transport system ATP-binding protein